MSDWREFAACFGMDADIFFVDQFGDVSEAKRICARCVVRQDCLDYALANHERWGVWGGLSPRDRRSERRRRRMGVAS